MRRPRPPLRPSSSTRGASPRRTPLHACSRGPLRPPLRARGSLAGAHSRGSDSCAGHARRCGHHHQPGGLRPAGPPYTRARGDPCDPRCARVAHSLALIREGLIHAPATPAVAAIIINPGGFAPPDPPTRVLAGTPATPAARAWLTRWRSFARV